MEARSEISLPYTLNSSIQFKMGTLESNFALSSSKSSHIHSQNFKKFLVYVQIFANA